MGILSNTQHQPYHWYPLIGFVCNDADLMSNTKWWYIITYFIIKSSWVILVILFYYLYYILYSWLIWCVDDWRSNVYKHNPHSICHCGYYYVCVHNLMYVCICVCVININGLHYVVLMQTSDRWKTYTNNDTNYIKKNIKSNNNQNNNNTDINYKY